MARAATLYCRRRRAGAAGAKLGYGLEALLSVGRFLLFWAWKNNCNHNPFDHLCAELIDPDTLAVVATDDSLLSGCFLVQHDAETVLGFRGEEVFEVCVLPQTVAEPLGRVVHFARVSGTKLFFSITARGGSMLPRLKDDTESCVDARGNVVFVTRSAEDDNFYTRVAVYRHPGHWTLSSASGVVPIRLQPPLRQAGPSWLCSVISLSNTVVFLRPAMAYWAAVQFPEQLIPGGAPLLLRDAPRVLAWEGLVLLFDGAAAPAFLLGESEAAGRVMVGRAVPLPPHLPRPRLWREDS